MANQVTENLFTAIDEIISSRMQGLGYDTTIKAIVLDASEAEKGFYQVAEVGSEKTNPFKAYSDNTSYVANDYVYVTTPLGDATSNNRIIIGKYVDENDEYYNYVNPMDKFLDITGNLITHLDKKEYGIIANHEPHSETRLWEDHGLNLRGFDRLAIKGEFKTWLQSLDIFSGSYGLVLVIQDNNNEFTSFSLTNKEMYGNPYYFETFYKQEVLIDISKIDEITSMWLSLIQCNDFLKSDGSLAPVVESSNIFLRAPYISVGYDISNFEGDDLRISTEDELDWNGTEDPVTKTIDAKWIHVPEGASAIVVDERAEIPRNPDYKGDNKDLSRYPQPEFKVDIRWFQHVDSYTTMVANKINDIEADMVIIKERINALENPPEEEKTSDLIDTSDLEIKDAEQYPEMTLDEMKAQLKKYEVELAEQEALYLSKNPPIAEEDDLTKRRYTGYKHKDRNWVEIESTLDQNFYPKNDFSYTFTTPLADTTTPALRFKAIASVPSERYVNAQFALTEDYKALANLPNNVATVAECLDLFYEVMDGTTTLTTARKAISKLYKDKGDMSQEDYQTITSALTAYATARSEIKHIESQELTFPNLGYYPDKYKDDIANLHIIVDPDGLKGQYLIYDDSGIITDETQASEERYCEAVYTTLAGVLNSEYSQLQDFTYEVDKSELICWYIPLENTMIATPVESIEYFPGKGDAVITDYVITNANNDEGLPLGHYCKIERNPQREKTEINDAELIAEHHMYSRQTFRIKDYYTQMETNNFIYCRVTKKSTNQTASANMAFGISGTNGTNSTFIIRTYEINEDGTISNIPTTALSLSTTREVENLDGEIVKRITGTGNGEIGLVPELYDYNNKLLVDYFKDHTVTYKFKSDYDDYPFSIRNEPNGCAIISWAGINDLNDINKDFYLVVEAEVPYKIVYNFATYTQEDLDAEPELAELGKKVGDYKLDEQGNKIPDEDSKTREDALKVFTPISIVAHKLLRQEKKVSKGKETFEKLNPKDYERQILGANKVIYDRNGSNAKFYKDPYQLFDSLLEEVEGITWSARIRASNGANSPAEAATIESFYPTVTPSGVLQPLEMFILGTDSEDGIPGNFCVQGKDANGKVVCIQPVLIMQNKYGSSMLNQWDGGLTIDEKNGTILASMVGAGIKDKNNTFSGVLMGDITQAYKDNHNGLGLYGFHESDQSFGFNVDGTAFIGKLGHGRIWFDGNNGTITSGTYSDGCSAKYKILGAAEKDLADRSDVRPPQGMEIDLDGSDGISSSIKAFGSAGGFVLDTKGRPSEKDRQNANYIPLSQRPSDAADDAGVVTEDEIADYYTKLNGDDEERVPVTFKLFTGTYNNRKDPDTKLGQYYNENRPLERGMIYFDNDGQYIQSTNYNGKYGTREVHSQRLSKIATDLNISINNVKFTNIPEGLNGQTIPPGWVDYDDANEQFIEYSGDESADKGTFIDLRNGWIDTRNGIIGGWQIGKNSLMSSKQEIILWAGDPNSSDDIEKNPYIKIGRIEEVNGVQKMQGRIWIAGYQVLGESFGQNISFANGISSNPVQLTITTGEGSDTWGNWDNSILTSTSFNITSGNTLTLSNTSTNSWILFDDTIEQNPPGIRLRSIKSSSGSLILLNPYNASSILSSLGTEEEAWGSAYTTNGFYFKERIEVDGVLKAEGWHLGATQEWVNRVVVDVLNERIRQVSYTAWQAHWKAAKALKALSGNEFLTLEATTYDGSYITFSTFSYGYDAQSGGKGSGRLELSSKNMKGFKSTVYDDLSDLYDKLQTLDEEVVADLISRVETLEAIDHTAFASSNHSHNYAAASHSHSVSGTDSMGGAISGTAS